MSDLPAPPAPLSVSELNRRAREHLEAGFPLCWVAGEISNLTYASSGHVYFSLKDRHAQVRCTIWRNRAQLLGWRLENGQQVEVRALVTLYEARGDFQLNVDSVRRAGVGNLYERYLQLKAQLEAEGLFASADKRPLPTHPRAIGIVTSLQAAALRDVLTTLRRRAPHIPVVIVPTAVQGDGAVAGIVQALRALADGERCDVVLLCRGGGSIEDLWAFNDEAVARAIRASRIPVVSGIGHETDFTIADFAADLRAPTPTAAAELATPDRRELLLRLQRDGERLQRAYTNGINERYQRLDWLAARLRHPAGRIAEQREQLARLRQRLQQGARLCYREQRLALDFLERRLPRLQPDTKNLQQRLNQLGERLSNAQRHGFALHAARLAQLAGSLRQLDPEAVLARGYAIAFAADGRAVRDSSQLAAGQSLQLRLRHGEAAVIVERLVPVDQPD